MLLRIFLSWSGPRSKAMANVLKWWLPRLISNIRPWVSEDIPKGARWAMELEKQLESHQIGIICLTPENLYSPWLLFEAGALSKAVGDAKIFPLLLDIPSSGLTGPLTQFQATTFDRNKLEGSKAQMLSMAQGLNRALEQDQVESDVLIDSFERLWNDLKEKLIKDTKERPTVDESIIQTIEMAHLLEIESRIGDAQQPGMQVVVNSMQPVEMSSTDAAEVVIKNINAGVNYDYYFDYDAYEIYQSLASASFIANLVKTLATAEIPDPPSQKSETGNAEAAAKLCPKHSEFDYEKHGVFCRKCRLDILSRRVSIYFRPKASFYFCVHNVNTESAVCYLRYKAENRDGFVKWCMAGSANHVVSQLRASTDPATKGGGSSGSQIFQPTLTMDFDRSRDKDLDGSREKDLDRSRDNRFRDELIKQISEAFSEDLRPEAIEVCFGKLVAEEWAQKNISKLPKPSNPPETTITGDVSQEVAVSPSERPPAPPEEARMKAGA